MINEDSRLYHELSTIVHGTNETSPNYAFFKCHDLIRHQPLTITWDDVLPILTQLMVKHAGLTQIVERGPLDGALLTEAVNAVVAVIPPPQWERDEYPE